MSIKDICNKVPGWVKLARVFPHLSPRVQGEIRLAMQEEQERQLEQEQAAALGLTVDEFRLLKSLPIKW